MSEGYLTGDLTKDGVLAMEQVYLPRILTLEVALVTACGRIEEQLLALPEGEEKEALSKYLGLLALSLNNKEYLSRVFNEDMKHKLTITTFPLYDDRVARLSKDELPGPFNMCWHCLEPSVLCILKPNHEGDHRYSRFTVSDIKKEN